MRPLYRPRKPSPRVLLLSYSTTSPSVVMALKLSREDTYASHASMPAALAASISCLRKSCIPLRPLTRARPP